VIQLDNGGHDAINTTIAFVCGILGGCLKYFALTGPNILMIFALLQAMFTALVCGAAGVAGKELFTRRKEILRFIKMKLTRKKRIK